MYRKMASKKYVKTNEDVKAATSTTLTGDSEGALSLFFLLVVLNTSVKTRPGIFERILTHLQDLPIEVEKQGNCRTMNG